MVRAKKNTSEYGYQVPLPTADPDTTPSPAIEESTWGRQSKRNCLLGAHLHPCSEKEALAHGNTRCTKLGNGPVPVVHANAPTHLVMPSTAQPQPEAAKTNLTCFLQSSSKDASLQNDERARADVNSETDWKDRSLVKLFVDLCLDVKSKHGYVYGMWDIIAKKILEKEGLTFSVYKIGGQFLSLQRTYKVWSDLVANAAEDGSNYMYWTADRWDNYIKKHPDAKQYIDVGLEYEEEMKNLFSTPQLNPPHTSLGKSSLSKDKRDRKRRLSGFNDQFEEVSKTMKATEGPSIEECNQVLDNMEKMNRDSTVYMAACVIFCESRVHREQWMVLSKKPEKVRINWLLMIAKKMDLFG